MIVIKNFNKPMSLSFKISFYILKTLIFIVFSNSFAFGLCENVGSKAEREQCLLKEYQKVDKILNDEYKKTKKRFNLTEQEMFIAAQRAWIKFRDSNCKHIDVIKTVNQSESSQILLECKIIMTKYRVDEIIDLRTLNHHNRARLHPCATQAIEYFITGNSKFPAIGANTKKTPELSKISFKANYSEIIRKPGMQDTKIRNDSLNKLPLSTIIYTQSLIYNNFLQSPGTIADRFYGVTLDNYSDLVDFFLYLSPLPNSSSKLWTYSLSVEQKVGGKPFSIKSLLISDSGNILYGENDSPYSWMTGNVTKNGANELNVDIISDLPGRHSSNRTATITTYAIKEGKELIELTRKSQDIDDYWNN